MHQSSNETHSQFINDIAWGPLATVHTWPIYFVNGFKFHTTPWSEGKATSNNGVCVRGADSGQCENDYYGTLDEIVELEYPGEPIKRVVLFKCTWFDPTPNVGTRVHKRYGIIEVHSQRRYPKYEPFVIAQKATQVYYTPYPERRRDNSNWWVVIKTKARSIVEESGYERSPAHAYQENENAGVLPVIHEIEEINNLRDDDNDYEEEDEILMDERDENEEAEEDFDDSDSTREEVLEGYVESDDDWLD